MNKSCCGEHDVTVLTTGNSCIVSPAQASLKLFLDAPKRSELSDPCAARILEQGNVQTRAFALRGPLDTGAGVSFSAMPESRIDT